METERCASRSALSIRPRKGEAIKIDPCAFAGKGGAVIDATTGGLRLGPAKRQENRMWTQPLYAPVPKAPKAASGDKREPPASQSRGGRRAVECGNGSVIAADEGDEFALDLDVVGAEDLRAEGGVGRFEGDGTALLA